MKEEELIELIQESLPEQLTEEQIAALRENMRHSPAVRDALADELAVEQGLATEYAPPLDDVDAAVGEIAKLSGARTRGRWVKYSAFLVVAIVAVTGIAMWANQKPPQSDPNELAVVDDQDVTDIEDDKGEGLDGGQNVTDPTNVVVDGGDDGSDDQQQHNIVPVAVVVDAGEPLSRWAPYDLPSDRGDDDWQSQFEGMFAAAAGSGVYHKGDHFDVRGTLTLLPKVNAQQAVRLLLENDWKIEAWHGVEGVVFEPDGSGVVMAHTVERRESGDAESDLPKDSDKRFYRQTVRRRIDPNLDFKWQKPPMEGAPQENFAVRWTGQLNVPRTGRYRFYATSDDGVRLYVGGRLVLENWSDHAAETKEGGVRLKAGRVPIIVEYYQSTGAAELKLEWDARNRDRQVIPTSVFYASRDNDAPHGLTGRYAWGDYTDPQRVEYTARRVVASDEGQWSFFRKGPFDLRYQDGRMLLTSGQRVLVSATLAEPPDEVRLSLHGTMHLAQLRRVEQLVSPVGTLAAVTAKDSDQPAKLNWEVDIPRSSSFVRHDDWTVELVSRNAEGADTAVLALPHQHGIDVVFRVDQADAGTGLQVRADGEIKPFELFVGESRGQRVLADAWHESAFESRRQRGFMADGPFWVRLRVMNDYLDADYSVDGEQWVHVTRRSIDTSSPQAKFTRFGVVAKPGEQQRRIRIGALRVKRYAALEGLAPEGMARRITLEDAQRDKSAIDLEALHETLAARKPKNVDLREWRLAVNIALVHQARTVALREAAAVDAMRTVVDSASFTDLDAVVAALHEFPTRFARQMTDGANWSGFRGWYDQLASAAVDQQRHDVLALLFDAWLAQPLGPAAISLDSKEAVVPPQLARSTFYDLYDRRAWEALLLRAMQYRFLSTNRDGKVRGYEQLDVVNAQLSAWALRRAAGEAGSAAKLAFDTEPREWQHPLSVDADRESLNTLAEFQASIEVGAYDHACLVLTRQDVPLGLAPTSSDPGLYKSGQIMIRDLIRGNKELSRTLRQDYADVGMLRLQQALQAQHYGALEPLVTQFLGTEASAQALLHLADRDLSLGNFFSAAARYRQLLSESAQIDRTAVLAKLKLAMALVGEKAGQQLRGTVNLEGGRFKSSDFDKMLDELIAERQHSGSSVSTAGRGSASAPPPGRFRAEAFAEISANRSSRLGDSSVAIALAGDRVVTYIRGEIAVWDAGSKKRLWVQGERNHRERPFGRFEPLQPVVHGDRIYARYEHGSRSALFCLDAERSGEIVWSQSYDDGLLANPLLVGSWMYVVTKRDRRGDQFDIVLRRLAPDNGESVMEATLATFTQQADTDNASELTFAGDRLLFYFANTLTCVDLLGELQWVRKTTYVHEDIDRLLWQGRTPVRVLSNDKVAVVAAPGDPGILCVGLSSGDERWHRLDLDVRQLVAMVDGQLIVAGADTLYAVDLETGKALWQRPLAVSPTAVRPAGEGQLLSVQLAKRKEGKDSGPGQVMTWIDAATGKTVKEESLSDEKLYNVEALVTNGREIYGIANEERHRRADVFRLRPR